jgi:hypothetical protein
VRLVESLAEVCIDVQVQESRRRRSAIQRRPRLVPGGTIRFVIGAHRACAFVLTELGDFPGWAVLVGCLTASRSAFNQALASSRSRIMATPARLTPAATRSATRRTRSRILGDNLDTDQVEAEYEAGVLRLTIPVSEQAKPRKIEIASNGKRQAITS